MAHGREGARAGSPGGDPDPGRTGPAAHGRRAAAHPFFHPEDRAVVHPFFHPFQEEGTGAALGAVLGAGRGRARGCARGDAPAG